MRPRFTTAVKATITADWAARFPALGVLKPMWLARRVGPMLHGIRLERDAERDDYRPMTFAHCLCQPAESVALGIVQTLRTKRTSAPDSISVVGHAARHVEAAARLGSQSLLPLDRPFSLRELREALLRHGEAPGSPQPMWAIGDCVAVLCWAERRAEAEQLVVESIERARGWPLGQARRRDWWVAWEASLRVLLARDDYARTVEEQIARHALGALPSAELASDAPAVEAPPIAPIAP